MIGSLLKECKIVAISPDATGATTDINPVTIDMSGFKSCLIIAYLGDVADTCVLHLKALQGTAANGSGATAIAGTTAATAGASNYDDKILLLDVKNVIYRYLTPQLLRGTANAAVNGIVAILYNGRDCPVTQGSDVMQSTLIQAA